MQHSEFFELDAILPDPQTILGDAVYSNLEAGYRPMEEYQDTRDQIFSDHVRDYINYHEIGELDQEVRASMSEEDFRDHNSQVWRDSRESLARDIVGIAIRENNSDNLSFALNVIDDVKDLRFATDYGQRFENIVEFATYSETMAGRLQVEGVAQDFHSETDSDVMDVVMKAAGEAYGKEEAQKMRAQAFMDYGFVAIRSDDSTKQINQDESVSIDVEFEDEIFTLTYEENEDSAYEVKMDRSFESLASKICESRGLGEIHPSNMLTTLTENGALTEANQSIGYYLRQPEAQKELASIRAENAAQTQANQLSSMISEGGQKEVKGFLNHTAAILGENEDLITKIQKGSITADSEEMQKAVRAAITRQQSSMEALGNQVLNDPKVAKGYTDFIADKLQQAGGDAVSGATPEAEDSLQVVRGKAAMAMQANGDAMEQLLNSVGKALDGAYKGNTSSDEYVRYDTVREPFIDNLISLKENDFFSKAPERVGELIVGLEKATGGKVFLNEKGTLEFSGDLGKTGSLREASLGIKDCLDRARADEQSQKAFWENARQDHANRLQTNDGIAKDLGAAAMPEVIGALKKSMEGMLTSGMSADAKQDFFKAQGEASKALDSMAGLGASNDPQKVAKMMTDFESSFGGKFSKSEDGKLNFDYKNPVDARQATDLAQETGKFAKGAVMAEKAAERQGPTLEAQKAPAAQAPKEAPIETSSTGRITGGGRFSRPPSPEAVAQARQEPPERKRSSGRSL